MWPRHKARLPYALESVNQQDFAYINKLWSTLPLAVQQLYRAMAVGTPLTGKDIYVICYMKGVDYGQD